MTLDNQKPLPRKLTIPVILKEKLTAYCNCTITKEELKLFEIALVCVEKQLILDNINLTDFYKLNVFFTEKGSISFHENDERNNGSQIYMAIYRMMKLRKLNSSVFTLFVFIEELAHYFWREYDETAVKYKVVEIINHSVPNLTIEDVKGWGLNGL